MMRHEASPEAAGVRLPLWTSSQPPAYQAHDTPFSDSLSPIVRAVCVGRDSSLGGAALGPAGKTGCKVP